LLTRATYYSPTKFFISENFDIFHFLIVKRYLLNFMEDNIHLLNYEQRLLKNRLKEKETEIDWQTEQYYTEKHYKKYNKIISFFGSIIC